MHRSVCSEFPGQVFPKVDGDGLLHCLRRRLRPVPQTTEHCPQALHSDQPPSSLLKKMQTKLSLLPIGQIKYILFDIQIDIQYQAKYGKQRRDSGSIIHN